jgi:FdhD protein
MVTETATSLPVTRYDGQSGTVTTDTLAIEEPLEIRVAGEPVAVTMRTPGQDEWLTAGFLLSEGIISSISDVSRISHCGRPGTDEYASTIDVIPSPGTTFDIERVSASKRGTLTTSACGVCGRKSIEDLVDRCVPISSGPSVSADIIRKSIATLRDSQPTFELTGGVHAASICDRKGESLACCEDIGRHNAVDKAVGSLLFRKTWPDQATILAVSGRASFEMIQKAATAGLPVVASVSAASTLAVSLADKLGITLAGFVRGSTMNIYSHPERITE